ncbi:tetratricopeptide repeat protein [Streptomyces sparsogenes]|uniref:tetratricopeptide repeat protein n=1 Tax=Streptomyces sparsogenes TaxID=67365 RepID=UPI0033CAF695
MNESREPADDFTPYDAPADPDLLDAAIDAHLAGAEAADGPGTRAAHLGAAGLLVERRGSTTGTPEDLRLAADLLREAAAGFDDPARRGRTLYNLGNVLARIEHRTGSFAALREAVDAYREALPLLSGGTRLACATNMLPVLLSAGARGREPDLTREAIRLALEFLDQAPSDIRAETGVWEALLTGLTESETSDSTCLDLVEAAIALAARPAADDLRASRFDRLGRLLTVVGISADELSLLRQAVQAGLRAVALRPGDGHLEANLARSLRETGARESDPGLLQEAVRRVRDALAHTPPGSPDHHSMRDDLGTALLSLSEHRADPALLREAVEHCAAAVEHADGPHQSAVRLFHLATARQQLASHTQDRRLMGAAIDAYRRALAHPFPPVGRAAMLVNYASALWHHTGGFEAPADDLRAAIDAAGEAVALLPEHSPLLERTLELYSGLHLNLFARDWSGAHVDAAIDAWENVLDRASARGWGHLAAPCLAGLMVAYRSRYERAHDARDIDRAVDRGERLLALLPGDHPERPEYLVELSTALRLRAAATRALADLDRAIDHGATALTRADPGDPRLAGWLAQQSANHRERYEQADRHDDLDQAVTLARRACATGVPQPPESPARVHLAGALSLRYQLRRDPADLEQAVEILRAARQWARSRTAGHGGDSEHADGDRALAILYNLSTALLQRHADHGIPSDLQEALDAIVTVVDATPERHHARADRLTTAASAFRRRWLSEGDEEDFTRAVGYAEEGLRHARPGSFPHDNAVATLLGIHADRSRVPEGHGAARDRAVELGLRMLARTDRPERSRVLTAHNTACVLFRRWEDGRAETDLELAVTLLREVVTAVGHERAPVSAVLLGEVLARRGEQPDGTFRSPEAAEILRQVATLDTASTDTRFHAARMWVTVADRSGEEVLDACRLLLGLLSLSAWRGKPRAVREAPLARGQGLASQAARVALDADRPDLAVEFLERGRGVLWSQLLDLRTDLARIRAADPELAARMTAVRDALDRPDAAEDDGPWDARRPQTRDHSDVPPLDPDWGAALREADDLLRRGDTAALFDVLAPLAEADDPRVRATAELGRGLVLLERGEQEAARSALARAARSGPDGHAPTAANLLGDLLAADQDLEGARAAYERARAGADRAQADRAEARLDELAALQEALEQLPPPARQVVASGDPARMAALAEALVTDGRFAQALVVLDRLRPLVSEEQKPAYAGLLGLAREYTGDYAGARAAWEFAARSPHADIASRAALSLGDLLVAEFTVAEAFDAYRLAAAGDAASLAQQRLAALRPVPPLPDAAVPSLFDYGRWVAHQEPPQAAAGALTAAIDAGDHRARTHYYLSEIPVQRPPEEVQSALHRVIALAGPDETALVLLCRARLRERRGDEAGARQCYDEAYRAAVASGDSELATLAAVKLAKVLQRDGDFPAAREAYERAIRAGHAQHSPAAAFDLARMLSENGREDEAREVYRQVMATEHPVQGGMSAINLGASLLEAGDLTGARRAFEYAAGGPWQDAAARAGQWLARLEAES